jgi:molybdenum cofactor biosynthesis protein MoaC
LLDISHKYPTLRSAVAEAKLSLLPATLAIIHSRQVPKGDPLEIARAAAVLAAKNTPSLIPYCHPIPITFVGVDFELGESSVTIQATVKAIAATGVEMEAMTAASVAALTLYDMLKMLDETMAIEGVRLLKKRGGKSDFRESLERPLRAAVIVMSDTVAAGKKPDSSGRLIEERMRREGLEVVEYQVIPDEQEQIIRLISSLADEQGLDLILTTGGTGFSPRDTTPEAMTKVIDREIPGIPEAVRAYGQQRTPYSMLSRARAGLRGKTLIVNLPGSRKGVAESLDLLFPALLHAFPMIWGGSGWNKPHKEDG